MNKPVKILNTLTIDLSHCGFDVGEYLSVKAGMPMFQESEQLRKGVAYSTLSGRLPRQTPGHYIGSACGVQDLEIERSSQKLRGFPAVEPAFRQGLTFIAGSQPLRGKAGVIKRPSGEEAVAHGHSSGIEGTPGPRKSGIVKRLGNNARRNVSGSGHIVEDVRHAIPAAWVDCQYRLSPEKE